MLGVGVAVMVGTADGDCVGVLCVEAALAADSSNAETMVTNEIAVAIATKNRPLDAGGSLVIAA